MPGPPLPHARMFGFLPPLPALSPAVLLCDVRGSACRHRGILLLQHTPRLWLQGLGREKRNMLPRRARADAHSRTRRLWDHRGHIPGTQHSVFLTELPAQSCPAAPASPVAPLSPLRSLRPSDVGGAYLNAVILSPSGRQGTNLHPLLLGRNYHTRDTIAVIPWSSRTLW